MARSNNTATASGSTGTWISYSDSSTTTAGTLNSRYRYSYAEPKEFHCHSCKGNYKGKGKTHPDYPEVLVCDKCIKERNKHLMLVMDEEKI